MYLDQEPTQKVEKIIEEQQDKQVLSEKLEPGAMIIMDFPRSYIGEHRWLMSFPMRGFKLFTYNEPLVDARKLAS